MTQPLRTRRKRSHSYHHGSLRRALIEEAVRTIRAQGIAGLTVREIGAQLGVSRTALYRHFADKQALLDAVAAEGFRMLRARLVTAWEQGGRGQAAFESMGRAYIRFARSNPEYYRAMFGSSVHPKASAAELAAEAAGAFQALVDALAALQHDGALRSDDTITMARFVWAVVHGIAMLSIDGRLSDPAEVALMLPYALERLRTGIEAKPTVD
jgi:AcrR family transcriptional regulator